VWCRTVRRVLFTSPAVRVIPVLNRLNAGTAYEFVIDRACLSKPGPNDKLSQVDCTDGRNSTRDISNSR
jgi:hypothetical protein